MNLIDAQETPNPNAMKFTLPFSIIENGSRSYASAAEATDNELAARLFEVDGVRMLFMLKNFITVTKDPAQSWQSITGPVEQILGHWSKKLN